MHGIRWVQLPLSPQAPVLRAHIRNGQLHTLTQLLPTGPSAEPLDTTGSTFLHLVAMTQHVPLMEWALTFSPDLNLPDANGDTPLMVCAESHCQDMLTCLLTQGADVNHANSEGWTALHQAAYWEWVEGVTLLLHAGADPEARTLRDHFSIAAGDPGGHLPGDLFYPWSGETGVPRLETHERTLIRSLLQQAREPGCGLK
jgi:uncharacterized protein